jgi:anti-sigma factor (TIGR02949 family)
VNEPHKTITCEEALRFLAAFLDGELEPTHEADVESHLATCRSCWSRAEFERQLKGRVASLREEPVPQTLEARVISLLGKFARS